MATRSTREGAEIGHVRPTMAYKASIAHSALAWTGPLTRLNQIAGTFFGIDPDKLVMQGPQTQETAARVGPERLEPAKETPDIGHFQIDPVTGTTAWSHQVFRIFGLSPERAAPTVENYRSMIHSEDRSAIHALAQRCFRERKPFDLTYRIYRADGDVRVVHAVAQWKRATHSEVLFGTLVDITESYCKTEARNASEWIFRSLVESSHVHVFMLDLTGTFLASNDWVYHFGKGSGAEIIGCNVSDVFPPGIASLYSAHLENVRRTGRREVFEHSTLKPNGTTHHRSTFNPLIRNGKLWAVGGTCHDISEQKTALLALQQSQRKLEFLYENSPLACGSISAKGIIIEVNATWLRLLGYERSEVVGRPLRDFLEKTCRDIHVQPDLETEMTLIRKGGSQVTVLLHCRSVWTGSGEEGALNCILQDVTKQKASLRETEHLARIGSWEHDTRTGRTRWSDEMYRLFGRNPADGPPEFEEKARFYGENESLFRDVVRRALERGESTEAVFEVALPDMRRLWHRNIVDSDCDSEGNVVRLFGTVQDVTKQRNMEKQLQEIQALLAQRDQELERKGLALRELIQHLRESGESNSLAEQRPQRREHTRIPDVLSVLTQREIQVCLQIYRGLSSKEIAYQMNISPRSVETHRNHIRRKLRLERRNLFAYLQKVLGQPSE